MNDQDRESTDAAWYPRWRRKHRDTRSPAERRPRRTQRGILGGMGRRWLPVALAGLMVSACGWGPSDDNDSADANQAHTGETVQIGLPFPSNLAGLGAVFGEAFGGATPPSDDQVKSFYQSIVDHINNDGGLLGKKIKPVFHGVSVTEAAGSAADEAMCTDFTQDHRVFAVMALPNHSENLVSCLEKANVITLDPVISVALDDTAFAEHPLYATAGALSLSRVAAVQVNGLVQQGFFAPDAKIGLIGYNTAPFTRAIEETLKPTLAKHGLTIADEQLVKPVAGSADRTAAQQAISNAVLRFKGAGIDHVLFFDVQGGTLTPWAKTATSQQYYPRLGISTNQNPGHLSYAGNKKDTDQINRYSTALGVGWSTMMDLAAPPANPTGELCTSIMKAAGASTDQTEMFWALCDQLLVFAAAVNAGGELTPAAALAGLEKAENLPSAELAGPPDFSGGRRDGAGVVKFLSFAKDCECFQYSSDAIPVSALLGG